MITTSAVSAMAAAYHAPGDRDDGSQERSLSDNASMRDVPRPDDPDRRLLSLDVFRGITVAAMILVNNPGTWRAVYAPLRHADWHGWTPTDLIFPCFLFIVGVAIPFGLGRRLDADHARGQVVQKVLWRALVIFFLGLVLHAVSSMDPATIRIPGVLQRIAVCYLVASLVFLFFARGAQLLIAAVAILAYWAALTLIPVPGFGAGDLGKEGNLAAWIDRSVLGAHIWRVGRVYDPEGILSTIPAIATTLFGVLTGQWLRGAPVSAASAGRLLLSGVAGVVIGLAWGRWFPINKSLWTSSYAVFTAGAALLGLAACYWLIEIKRSRWWTGPFRILGVNALAVFFLSTLLAILLARVSIPGTDGRPHSLQAILFGALFAPWASPAAASLSWAATNVVLWLLLLWPFSRKGLRLTV
jgi:predicted acyltransferase